LKNVTRFKTNQNCKNSYGHL